MTYTVHRIFRTLQGEGYHAGRAAVFCRFAGCNLWSGREKDRASAVCRFCDTEFVGGRKYQAAADLGAEIEAEWGGSKAHRMVVFTGGEPGLQLDGALIDDVRARGFAAHVETNGTIKLPRRVWWTTLSPKAGTRLLQAEADELKVAWPQDMDVEALRETVGAALNFLQPIDGPEYRQNLNRAIGYVGAHPWWRLSLQTHKLAGIP